MDEKQEKQTQLRLTERLGKSLPNTESSTTKAEKTKQIVDFVRQCFDMQDTYGLTADQLKNRMRGIVEDVVEFDAEIISEAFRQWRRTSRKIPTPFDIRSLCEGKATQNRQFKTLADFEGDFKKYMQYAKENGFARRGSRT